MRWGRRTRVLEILPGEEALAARLGWTTPEEVVADRRGTPLRATPRRVTVRLEPPQGDGMPRALILKRHGRPRLPWGHSPARVEWDNLRRVAAAGLAVPRPVLLAECPSGSALVLREVEGALPLDAWLEARAPRGEGERSALLAALLPAVAGLAARFHDAGFHHRDLYLCHLLQRAAGEVPVLIDLHRVRHRPRARRRWFVKDLAALHFSAPAWVGGGRRLRFLRTYLSLRGLGADWKPWARAVAAKARRIAAHTPRHG